MKQDVDHTKRAEQAWPHLVERARTRKATAFTYGEIGDLVGVHPRSARYFLGVIQRYCRDQKLPPLQALAVNKSTRLPGEGYRGSDRSREEHDAAVQSVANFDWPTVVPDLSGYPRLKKSKNARR